MFLKTLQLISKLLRLTVLMHFVPQVFVVIRTHVAHTSVRVEQLHINCYHLSSIQHKFNVSRNTLEIFNDDSNVILWDVIDTYRLLGPACTPFSHLRFRPYFSFTILERKMLGRSRGATQLLRRLFPSQSHLRTAVKDFHEKPIVVKIERFRTTSKGDKGW